MEAKILQLYMDTIRKDDIKLDIVNLLDLLCAILGIFVHSYFFYGAILFTSIYVLAIVTRAKNMHTYNRFFNYKLKLNLNQFIGFLLGVIDITLTLLIVLNFTILISASKLIIVLSRNVTKAKAFSSLKKLIPIKIIFIKFKKDFQKSLNNGVRKSNVCVDSLVYNKNTNKKGDSVMSFIENLLAVKNGLVEERELSIKSKEEEFIVKEQELKERLEKQYQEDLNALEEAKRVEFEKIENDYQLNVQSIDKLIQSKQPRQEEHQPNQELETAQAFVTEDVSNNPFAEELIVNN